MLMTEDQPEPVVSEEFFYAAWLYNEYKWLLQYPIKRSAGTHKRLVLFLISPPTAFI